MKSLNQTLMNVLPFILLTCQLCPAVTITVDPNGSRDFASIQDAINYAYDFDTVVVYPGLYEEHINYNSAWITITSIDPNDRQTVDNTIIDGSGEGNVVTFSNAEGSLVSLCGFAIQNGDVGISCNGADVAPMISKCLIKSNSVGISCSSSSKPSIVSSTISSNTQNGIVNSQGSVSNCNITGNGMSGMVDCIGDITNCVFENNGESGIKRHKGTIKNSLIHANLSHGIMYPYSLHATWHCTIVNCTIVGNKGDGIHLEINEHCSMPISNTIIAMNYNYGIRNTFGVPVTIDFCNAWGNKMGSFRFENWNPIRQGSHMISEKPFFAKSGYWDEDNTWHEGEYHLLSKAGRWDTRSQDWVQDPIDSPCLDRGNPNTSIGDEPLPNGGVINMGAYGGTLKASMSGGPAPICTKFPTMDFNKDCKVDLLDYNIFMEHWLECNLDPDNACDFVIEESQ